MSLPLHMRERSSRRSGSGVSGVARGRFTGDMGHGGRRMARTCHGMGRICEHTDIVSSDGGFYLSVMDAGRLLNTVQHVNVLTST
jgi:hypothetical protein